MSKVSSVQCISEGAKKKRRKIHDPSHISSSPSEPPVYIWFLYKLINVINRPGRIAWESVFCTETVSILNEREGGWRGSREKEISTFFSSCIVLFLILICPLCPLLCRVCRNQQESDTTAEVQILLSLSKPVWLNRNWTSVFPHTINQAQQQQGAFYEERF